MCRSSMAVLAFALVAATRIVASEPIVISGRVLDSALQPVSGANVTLEQRFGEQLQRVEVVADNHGEFQLSIAIDKHVLPSTHLQAVSPDGKYMGSYRFPWEPPGDAVPDVEIRVQETRRLQVRVIDQQQQTVSGAKVSLQLQFPITVRAEFTDDAGVATFRIPVTERVEAAVAWKDHVGLDYRRYAASWPRGRCPCSRASSQPRDCSS